MPNADAAPLLVYHPRGGMSNSLFGLSSSALLATVLCRRFAVAWGTNTNIQAGAAFEALFQRPAGVEFLNESEGTATMVALGGSNAHNCTVQLTDRGWSEGSLPLSNMSDPRSFNFVDSRGFRTAATSCPVLHVRSNMYYAPILIRNPRTTPAVRWLRQRGLQCRADRHEGAGAAASAKHDVSKSMPPYFAAISRHLFVPHEHNSRRAEMAIEQNASGTLIGVHVRMVILLALHGAQFRAASGEAAAAAAAIADTAHGQTHGTAVSKHAHQSVNSRPGVLRVYGFLDCIAKVRNASAAGSDTASRVYVASDNPSMRAEATAALGSVVMAPPPHILVGHEKPREMAKKRGVIATAGALDEMLILARTDAIIVWDLEDSTYSAVAASWAAHRVHSRSSQWHGVYIVSQGCKRIPDEMVEPPAHTIFNRTWTTRQQTSVRRAVKHNASTARTSSL